MNKERKKYIKEYYSKPENRARKKECEARPENRARKKKYYEENREYFLELMRKRSSLPETKEKRKL